MIFMKIVTKSPQGVRQLMRDVYETDKFDTAKTEV